MNAKKQFQWLEHLQQYNPEPILTNHGIITNDGMIYDKWIPYAENTFPITCRTPLQHEITIDFDGPKRYFNLKHAKKLEIELRKLIKDAKYLKYYITDHNGRGPHFHIFNQRTTFGRVLLKKIGHNNAEILVGRHMIRCIGGPYKDGIHYSSYFPTVDDIKPITNPNEIEYPFHLTFEPQIGAITNNYIKPKKPKQNYPKHKQVQENDWNIDNLPPKYKYLEHGIPEGKRHIELCRLIGVLKKCGLTEHQARHNIDTFINRCHPPLPEKEANYVFKRLWK